MEKSLGAWGDDIGLLYLVLLNAAVLVASWRLARRRSADALDAAGDAFLLFYFVQYASVCLTGVAGAMHALTIGLVALLASAFIALGSWRIAPRETADDLDAAPRASDGSAGVGGGEEQDARRESAPAAGDEAGGDEAAGAVRAAAGDEARGAVRPAGGAAPAAGDEAGGAVRAARGDEAGGAVGAAKPRAEKKVSTGGRAGGKRPHARRDVEPAPASWRQLWRRRRGRVIAVGAIVFVVGYIGALVFHQRRLPVISNDAITYHLPAAVQWLQTGRLGLYEAWYYNPANSYSPLGGSAFIAWLIAPVQNDSIARFVAVGPLLMLLIAMLNLCRRLGVDAGVAAIIAAACVLARPFAGQAILAKDDLFVAAFFIVLVGALSGERLSTRSGPFRAGMALGLLLAMKYTVLFSLPLLLLMFNRAWTLRRMLMAAGIATLIAGPWYLRNIELTGNPLYPAEVTIGGVTVFPGIIELARSHLLATPHGVWEVFAGGYYGLTSPIAIVLIAAWLGGVIVVVRGSREPSHGHGWASGDSERREGAEAAAGGAVRAKPQAEKKLSTGGAVQAAGGDEAGGAVGAAKSQAGKRLSTRGRGLGDPLERTCVIGSALGIAIFVLTAPYGEMRFAYPSISLLFACGAMALRRLPWPAQVLLAVAGMFLAAFTAFRPQAIVGFTATGAAIAVPAMLIALAPRRIAKLSAFAIGGVAALALAMYAYVDWQRYVRQTAADTVIAWSDRYGPIGELWHFIRTDESITGNVAVGASGAGGGSAGARGGSVGAGGGSVGAGGAGAGTAIGAGGTIAYANTFFTYPLMGYRYEHRVVHVPTRRDIERFTDLPRLPRKVTGEELVAEVVEELRQDPDRGAWLRRLRESGAQYLVVAKFDPAAPTQKVVAPELTFAEQDPQRFVRIFDNEAGSVFRIVW